MPTMAASGDPGSAAVSASTATVGSAAVAGSAGVVGSAAVTGSTAVVGSAAVAGSAGVVGSAAVLVSAGVVGSGTQYLSALQASPLVRPGSRTAGVIDPGYSDVMLLHTSVAMPSWMTAVPMATSWPAVGTTLTEYGYGRLTRDGSPSSTLQKTPDGDLKRVDCGVAAPGHPWKAGHVCAQGKVSTAWMGDSGGPLMWWNHGAWQELGDFSVFPSTAVGVHWQAYWSEADSDTRNWVHAAVTGPIIAGTIVRDPATGTSFLYGSDGYRHWIPDGHRKEHVPGALPRSLGEALRAFILACAARRARGTRRSHTAPSVRR